MEDRCPHANPKGYCNESITLCMLSEKPSGRIHPCLLESGRECEIWEEIKREDHRIFSLLPQWLIEWEKEQGLLKD